MATLRDGSPTTTNHLREFAWAALAVVVCSANAVWFSSSSLAKADVSKRSEPGWREMSIAAELPHFITATNQAKLSFQNGTKVPMIRLDGIEFNSMLPETLWIKLDQPGNAYLFVETDEGTFVRPLTEATPGFSSACRMSAYDFGTLDGEAVYLDRKEVPVQRLWVIQDAPADSKRVPGWISVEIAPTSSGPMPALAFAK